MTLPGKYPPVDPRRAPELRRVLLRDTAAMAAFWQGAFEGKGADRALIEIASRLFEESTSRLDKTPERDALAFFETFDFAPPLPKSAKGHVVFALKDDRSTPVEIATRSPLEIAARIGVGENAEIGKAPFETTQPMRIQPGRIAVVASVDPANDKIELAPDAVSTLEPDLEQRPQYTLQAAASGTSDVIAITPPAGLGPGDTLRVEMKAEPPKFLKIVEVSEDGRCQLAAQIGGAGVAQNTVRRITRQTSFDITAMPNLQEHGFYIGDKDLLNVEEPADITLKFDRTSVASALIAANVRFQIYGTRKDDITQNGDDPEPQWYDLVPLAGPGDDLVLRKAWNGTVDELKLSEDQEESARYIRIVPQGLLNSDAADSLIAETKGFRELTMGVKTRLPKGASDDTISQIAHNGAPLSLASPFNPFGAEPQRFDIFSVAAPEALTKRGATARLKFDMLDATVLSMKASTRSDVRHLFGLSRNGRLQVVDLSGANPIIRQISGPAGGDGSIDERFDPVGSFDAVPLDFAAGDISHDLVVATTQNGQSYVGVIQFDKTPGPADEPIQRVGDWQKLPDIEVNGLGQTPDGSPERPGLALLPHQVSNTEIQAELIAETSLKFYAIQIDRGGVPDPAGWVAVHEKGAGFAARLAPNVQRIEDSEFPNAANNHNAPWNRRGVLTTDAQGAIWRLARSGGQFVLHEVDTTPGNSTSLAGLIYNAGTELAVARVGNGRLQLVELALNNFGTAGVALAGPEIKAADGPVTALVALGSNAEEDQQPRVYAYTQGGAAGTLYCWDPEARTQQVIDIAGGRTVGVDQKVLPVFASARPFTGAVGNLPVLVMGGTQQKIFTYTPETVGVIGQVDWVPFRNVPNDLSDFAHAVRRRNQLTTEIEILTTGDAAFTRVGYVAGDPLNDDDDAIYAIGVGTDWAAPVEILTAANAAERAGVIDNSDVLTQDDGQAHGLLDDDLIFVSTTGDPPFNVFRVSVIDPDSVTLIAASDMTAAQFSDSLDDIGRNVTIQWRKADVAELAPADSALFHETLLIAAEPGITGFGGVIDQGGTPHELIVPDPRGVVLPGFSSVLVNGWTNAVPPNFASVPVLERAGQALSVVPVEVAARYANPQLSWEYFNGQGWKRLAVGFTDQTSNFAVSGEVSFTVPDDLSLVEIGGQEDFWIRARLVGGDYGQPKYIVTTVGPEQTITVDKSHMRPPEIARLSAAFHLPAELRPGVLVARNNRNDIDVTDANGVDGARLTAFQGVFQAPLTPHQGDLGLTPGLAILIGLTRRLATGSVSLLVKVDEGPPADAVQISVLGSDNRWTKASLTGPDPTHGLMLSGLLEFQLPVEPGQMRLLGKSLFWLRLDLKPGAELPRIKGLWLNGAPVGQSTSIRQELVGSILGEPKERFALLNTPVLPDTIELRLREDLSAEQVAKLRNFRGERAVLTDVANVPGTWVLWDRVDRLADQPSDARVYLADAAGNLQFGNGENGLMPTAGANKIRAFAYAQGGMRVETQAFAPAGATGSVEALERVLAPISIAGGRDLPGDAELVERIPDTLRHAGQGLSLADIEAMARDADNEIVHVRAFAPTGPGAKITIAVLARGKSRTPVYSRASRMALQRVLAARMSDAFGPDCLAVLSAPILSLEVDIKLIARDGQGAALDAAASEKMRDFLHPSIGGPAGNGWPPGRPIYETDIRRALMHLPGLDRIGAILIQRKGKVPYATTIGGTEVIGVTDTRDIRIVLTEGAP